MFTRDLASSATILAAALAIALAAASPAAARINTTVNADGDACTVGTNTPGTEKDGECCSNADPKDCVIILKPFPGSAVRSRRG